MSALPTIVVGHVLQALATASVVAEDRSRRSDGRRCREAHAKAVSARRSVRSAHSSRGRGACTARRRIRPRRRHPGGVPARRAGRGDPRLAAAAVRPGGLPHRAVRSTRLRPFHAPCLAGGQYHGPPAGRSRADPRAPGHRTVAGLWCRLGRYARAGLRRAPSGPRQRPAAAGRLPVPADGHRLVLSRGREPAAARGVARVPGAPDARRARRSARRLPSPAVRRRRYRPHGRGQGMGRLAGPSRDPAAGRRAAVAFRRPIGGVAAGTHPVRLHGSRRSPCARPVDQAAALAAAWPGGELDIVGDAGHAATEAGTVDALVRASDRLAGRLSP